MSNSKSQAKILTEIKVGLPSGARQWTKFVAELQQGTTSSKEKTRNQFQRPVLAFFNDWWEKTGKAFNKSRLKWFPNTKDGTKMQNLMLDRLFADVTAQSGRGRWEGLDDLLAEHAGFDERLAPTKFIGANSQSGSVDQNSVRERVAKALWNLNSR